MRTDIGEVDWGGVKLRSKFVTPATWDPHWRLGVNFEVAYLPTAYDHDQWGSEIRPIVAWHDEKWLFVLNPILDQPLAGSDASQGPSFQPALKIARTGGPIALGIEYYATLGPLTAIQPWEHQQQQIFEVVDLVSVDHLELNMGVGEGLTQDSAGVVLKMIVGYEFERSEPKTTPRNRRRCSGRGALRPPGAHEQAGDVRADPRANPGLLFGAEPEHRRLADRDEPADDVAAPARRARRSRSPSPKVPRRASTRAPPGDSAAHAGPSAARRRSGTSSSAMTSPDRERPRRHHERSPPRLMSSTSPRTKPT